MKVSVDKNGIILWSAMDKGHLCLTGTQMEFERGTKNNIIAIKLICNQQTVGIFFPRRKL